MQARDIKTHCHLLLLMAAFNLDYYTEVHDLSYLVRAMGNDPFAKRFRWVPCSPCMITGWVGHHSFGD